MEQKQEQRSELMNEYVTNSLCLFVFFGGMEWNGMGLTGYVCLYVIN
jgi:hypothetical protein